MSITLNGKEISESNKTKFYYYVDPVIRSVTPNLGPMKGGTISKLSGYGFAQDEVCNVTVRYGPFQQKILNYTDTDMLIVSPPANVPDAVVVSIALNGQQFIYDKTLHSRDVENTFTYYQDLFVQDFNPKAGPTSGKTKIKVTGMGFSQFKSDDGKKKQVPLFVRFRDSVTGDFISESTEAFDVTDEEFSWRTPPADLDTRAILEFSYNKQDWQTVLDTGKNYSY